MLRKPPVIDTEGFPTITTACATFTEAFPTITGACATFTEACATVTGTSWAEGEFMNRSIVRRDCVGFTTLDDASNVTRAFLSVL